MTRIPFYNISLDTVSLNELQDILTSYMDCSVAKTLFFLNAHCFNIAQENNEYLAVLKQASLLLNDGIGIDIAARFIGIKLKFNLNGTDLIPEILSLANGKNKNIYLLGGKPKVAEIAAQNLKLKFPKIKICGYNDGYFNNTKEEEILSEIRHKNIEILIVGMGVPLQEMWIYRNLDRLPTVKLAIAGGAILDFISGSITRAPSWMRKCRIEWLYRLLHEPKRTHKRIFIGGFKFIMNVLKFYFKQKSTI